MDRQYNDKWGAVNRRDGQTIRERRRSKTGPSLWFTAPHLSLYCLSISPIYCSSFVIVLSVHLSDLLLLICHCIVCPSLWFIAPHLSLYCLSISLIYIAPHLSLYCLSLSPIYCSSFVIVLSDHPSDLLLLICLCIVCPYNDKWGAINQRDGQTI
jgi:hypothetical protein